MGRAKKKAKSRKQMINRNSIKEKIGNEVHPKIWTQIMEVHFYISKLTREQKIQIYKKRKAGKSLQN